MGQKLILTIIFAVVLALSGCQLPRDKNVTGTISASGPNEKVFHEYDVQFIQSVQAHWYDLLDKTNEKWPVGEVILQFSLNEKGEISEMRVTKSTVDEQWSTICQHAILDSAPYREWPEQLRKSMDKPYRTIEFKFAYDPSQHRAKSK